MDFLVTENNDLEVAGHRVKEHREARALKQLEPNTELVFTMDQRSVEVKHKHFRVLIPWRKGWSVEQELIDRRSREQDGQHLVIILGKACSIEEVGIRKECLLWLFVLEHQVQMIEIERKRGPQSPLQSFAEAEQDLSVRLEFVVFLLQMLVLLLSLSFILVISLFIIWIIVLRLAWVAREKSALAASHLSGFHLDLAQL
jgi:hypothetical protein